MILPFIPWAKPHIDLQEYIDKKDWGPAPVYRTQSWYTWKPEEAKQWHDFLMKLRELT